MSARNPNTLTKREQFAAHAMSGFCSNIQLQLGHAKIAKMSVQIADMLIKELEKDK